ncbi:MAG: type IV pilus assembly protein PilM [candidate division Zixibacteria bacterium]|nr:type IV pilus assembly protein PilM [candidate division Zixibacteria bacterium]
MLFGQRSKTTLALDIGASSIKCVKLENRGSTYALRAMEMRDLPPEAIVGHEIKDRDTVIFNVQSAVEMCDPRARDVVVSVSGHAVIADKITIDRKTGVETEQAILFEAEQRAPYDLEDVAMDYHIIDIDEDSHKMDVLLVAARKDYLNSYLDLLLDANLRPVIVDTDAFAVLNAYEINYDINPERITALVNIGYDNSNVVFIKDGHFHSTRDVAVGGRIILDTIRKEFRLNQELATKTIKGEMESSIDQDMLKATIIAAAEELLSGLEVGFSYFRSLAQIDKIDWVVLSGGGALIPYLPEFLQAKLNIPVEIANPLRNIEYDPDMFTSVQPERIAPLLAVSIGLATRKV